MKVGLQIPRFNWPQGVEGLGGKFAEIAQAAEAAGFSSLWVMDHFFQITPGLGEAWDPMLEGYSALNYLAGVTEKVTLGTLVSGVIYRQPSFLVKQVTTLDVLSGGRAVFGVGAGWYEREARGLGFPFPPVKTRFEMLEETLQIAHQTWRDDRSPYQGRHFQLAEPIISPQPLTQPHPPIMIGGMGERKTLRFAAQYADACNLFGRVGEETLQHKLDVLKRHCDDLERDFSEIEITTLNSVHLAEGQMTAQNILALCKGQAELGVQQAIFNMPNDHAIAPLETFGREIIPELDGL